MKLNNMINKLTKILYVQTDIAKDVCQIKKHYIQNN